MLLSTRRFALRAVPCALLIAGVLAFPSAGSATTSAATVLTTGLPNRTLTPGVLNPAVTQATIHTTICVSGWTATIRPPSSYTTALKAEQLVTYGFVDATLSHYEEDHLISLELGGNPRSSANLWPEPHHIVLATGTDVGSYAKDAFETYLKRLVCAGKLSLASAQLRIRSNWVLYWRHAGLAPIPTVTQVVTSSRRTQLATPARRVNAEIAALTDS